MMVKRNDIQTKKRNKRKMRKVRMILRAGNQKRKMIRNLHKRMRILMVKNKLRRRPGKKLKKKKEFKERKGKKKDSERGKRKEGKERKRRKKKRKVKRQPVKMTRVSLRLKLNQRGQKVTRWLLPLKMTLKMMMVK